MGKRERVGDAVKSLIAGVWIIVSVGSGGARGQNGE